MKDLELAVQEMLNQYLQLADKAPVAQGVGTSVSEQAWSNQQRHLHELYANDTDLTAEHLQKVGAALAAPSGGLFKRWRR